MFEQSKEALPWHVEPIAKVYEELEVTSSGLTNDEAQRRLEQFGPNLLPEQGATPLWLIVARQFVSPLIFILIVAAVISIIIGDFKDAGFIAAVLAINAAIGAYQEAQAERSSQALRKLLRIHALVDREGEVNEIPSQEVVPGDIVWLESGNRVPADIRLAMAHGLEVDESLLTGESLAVTKDADWLGEPDTTVADRQNMVFAGAMVARGRAKGLVVATGTNTHVGRLAMDVVGSVGGKPPLLVRMERFSNYIAVGTLLASTMIGAIGYALWNYTLVDTFMLVVALAVSAIPEGLPVAMTVALAVATTRMAKRNVIVRRLTAVEGLGSCTLIATDKTGTLTCNELTVRSVLTPDHTEYQVTGEGFAPAGDVLRGETPVGELDAGSLREIVEGAVLCNEGQLHHRDGHWVWHGDAVDIALLCLGEKVGVARETLLDAWPQVNQIPFEPEYQYAATFHNNAAGETHVFVKGAPERVLEMCAENLGEDARGDMETIALDMAERGLRVIAVASGKLATPLPASDVPERPTGLTLLGFLGMIDPLRAGVRDAVERCHAAGVEVTMVTGDHRVTALAIARELGLAHDNSQVMTADELSGKSAEELPEIVERVRVFARVTPRQKLEIVNAARSAGHFVAVTGDGVNDAPALRAANIGVAMGKTGTDVAREAAELVLSDDNFSSILGGIEEGRIAYDNIRKVIFLLVSMGAAELLMVLFSVIMGLPVPLVAVQLLWLNLVTNGIQGVALAFEPGEGDALKRRPRPTDESIFNRLMVERILVSVFVVGIGGYLVFDLALRWGLSVPDARNVLLLTMVLFEIVHIGNCRSETRSAFALSPLRNPLLFFGSLMAFLLHLTAMHLPFFQNFLGTHPISLDTWGMTFAISLLVLPAIEIHKWWWNRRH